MKDDNLEPRDGVLAELRREIERRVEMEREASARETRLQTILDTIVDGIITTDKLGSILTLNRAAELMFGYTLKELVGKNVSTLMGEAGRTRQDHILSGYLRLGVAEIADRERSEVMGRNKNGHLFPVDLAVSESCIDEDECFTAVIRDLTERYRVDGKLRDREHRYRTMFDSAPIGIAVLDENDLVVESNAALATMLGRSTQDLAGRELHSLVAPEEERRHAGWRDEIHAGLRANYRFDRTMMRPDGSRVATSQTVSAVQDETGKFLYSIRMVEDVTERTRAVAELRRREQLFSILVNLAPVGIALVRGDDTAEEVNPAMERMFGVPSSVLSQKPFHSFIDPSVSRRGQGVRAQFVDGTIDEDVRERAFVRPDGVKLRALVYNSAVRDEQGTLTHLVRVVQDITERSRIEQSKSEFLAMASHELKTPLTAIHAALGLMRGGGLRAEAVKELVSIAAANSDRLVRLVGDLIDLEGMNLDKIVLNKETCNTIDITHEATALLAPLATEAGLRFVVDSSNSDFTADHDRILQVLTNLMSNAIKYAPRGSEVDVSTELVDDAIQFTIADRGPGIPQDQIELIFDSFRQVDQSDSRPHGGSGLGLTIAKAIVELHGGLIWAESTLGEGTSLSFTLPHHR